MNEIISLEQLYLKLRPAFFVKVRLLKERNFTYIRIEDIWNFLKETKWLITSNLGLAEMVSDIIHTSNYDIDKYVKNKLLSSERKIYFKEDVR